MSDEQEKLAIAPEHLIASLTRQRNALADQVAMLEAAIAQMQAQKSRGSNGDQGETA